MTPSASQSDITLPTPEERPDAEIVIYDGQCRICVGQVRKLLWWDCQGKLAYLSLHNPEVARRFPDLSHEQLMQEMVIVDRAGRRYFGAEAVRHLTLRLRRLWWLAPVLYFPFSLPLWKWLYRLIAKHRYKIGGKAGEECCTDGSCEVHGKERK